MLTCAQFSRSCTYKMKIKSVVQTRKNYNELNKVLESVNKAHLTSCDKKLLHDVRVQVEQIVRKIASAMLKESLTFSKLYYKIFGVGSAYEQTKIGKPNEFDIDIVLQLPKSLNPVMQEVEEFPGFTQIKFKDFHELARIDPETHRIFSDFIDNEDYLSSTKIQLFAQELFYVTKSKHFPEDTIIVGTKEYKISKIECIEPALTLTLQGLEFNVSVDLVTSFCLSEEFWPRNSRKNPCSFQRRFFLAPATPQDHTHRERFWRPSFHDQEKKILFNRHQLKPALRVLKRIRDHFNQAVHSYAIKTLFLWELDKDNSILWKSSLSFVVIYMLEKYMNCLMQRNIPCFWNSDLNLLSYLSCHELERCKKEITGALDEIQKNPQPAVLLKYLD